MRRTTKVWMLVKRGTNIIGVRQYQTRQIAVATVKDFPEYEAVRVTLSWDDGRPARKRGKVK